MRPTPGLNTIRCHRATIPSTYVARIMRERVAREGWYYRLVEWLLGAFND